MSMLLLVAMMAANPQFEARVGTHGTVVGPLIELSPKHVVLETLGGPRELAGVVFELSAIAPPKGAAAGPIRVDLIDGSSLVADEFTTSDGTAEIRAGEQTIKVPLRNLASVRLQQQSDVIAKQWNELLRGRHTGDVLVVRKQDAIDHLSGVLGDVGKETAQFEIDGEKIPVKRGKIAGIIYAPPAAVPDLAPSFCTLIDVTGSRVPARQVEIHGATLHVTSPAGLVVEWPLDLVRTIQFFQYLSDLEPESAEYVPYLSVTGNASKPTELFFGPRFNPPPEQPEMRLGGRSYTKGLVMHARSEVVYRLPGKYREFRALAGIDDSVRPSGDVKLSIYGDGRLLTESVLTGRDAPRPIEVDLRGVARLKIVADFDGDEIGDLLNLCEARVLE